jgi:hypothetical protein
MDRVRFGKALGNGTRDAARALLRAADAATSPNPTTGRRPESSADLGRNVSQTAVRTTEHIRRRTDGVKRGGKRFGETVWGPVARASSVLWLEVTGVFFGIFALTAGVEVFKHRADLHAAGPARQHLFFAVGMLVVFGWFTVSSFIQASRRSRR